MSIYHFDKADAKRFALEQHIATRTRGNELHFASCPYCGNQTDDKNTFAINLETGQFKCLRASCGVRGNMLTLSRDFNFSLGNDVDEYYQSRKKYRDLTRYPLPVTKPEAVQYMESRGISQAITEKYHISTQKTADNILVFPFTDEEGKLQFAKYRKTDFDKSKDKNKEWCEAGCKPILFGMEQCDPEAGPLVLTEGQIDSLSVAEAGIPNAVSVPTGAKGFTWIPYCWDFLGKFKTLIVFGDHEKDRITLLEEMRVRFHGTVKHVRPEDYLDCKDANELLLTHGKQAVINAVHNAIPVKNPRIKKLSEVERKDLSQLESFPTEIRTLDRTIGGLYFGQLIILTGERGLGKSTLASQLITRAVDNGYAAFCYSGELMDWFFQDWFDRQAAGPDYIDDVKNRIGGTTYSVACLHNKKIHDWYDEKMFIYDNSYVSDECDSLLEVMENAIKQYGCRVIMIDNLMTAMQEDVRSDFYRQQSRFVKKLAMLAKSQNVLVILVAHPRKTSVRGREDSFDNDDVSGSADITNLADVVMRYGKPHVKDDPDPGDRVLKIIKNRMNGKTHSGIKLWFDERSKRISENGDFRWELGWNNNQEFVPVDDLGDIPF